MTLALPLLFALVAAGDPVPGSPGANPEPSAANVTRPRQARDEAVHDPALSADWSDPSRLLSRLLFDDLGFERGAVHLDVLARGAYSNAKSELVDAFGRGPGRAPGAGDFNGFDLTDGDVAASVFIGPWTARASVDVGTGGPSLEDAYVRWSDRLWGEVTLGRFKPFVLRSSEADPEQLLFPTRTYLGSVFDRWDEGLEWHGRYDEFDWWIAGTQRRDGFEDDNFYSLRAEWAFYDENQPAKEGARYAPDHLQLVVGVVYWGDSTRGDVTRNDGVGIDSYFTLGPYSFGGEVMRVGPEVRLHPTEENDVPALNTGSESYPFSLTFGRMFGETLQVAIRHEGARDAAQTSYDGLGLNFFPFDAPIALQGEIAYVDRRDETGALFRVGFSYGTTRHDEPRYPR